VAALALRLSGGRPARLVVLVALATAVLAMWMSNVAAAALMLAALRPVVDGDASPSGSLRRPLLLAIALAADVGGIATPVGTGSNGIAMAALASTHPISFVQWMCFGVPLAFGLLAAALAVVVWRVRPAGVVALPAAAPSRMSAAAWRLAVVFGATVLLWLTEPLHGVRAWVVALGAVGALVLVGLLGWRDVRRMDWSTLLLIAGGIALGALLDASGLVRVGAAYVPLAARRRSSGSSRSASRARALGRDEQHRDGRLPRAAGPDARPRAVDRRPRRGLDVARGAVRHQHAAERDGGRARASSARASCCCPGLVIMLGGCVLVALTGPAVLRLFGIP
jgi:sodium-dependent dicarboxylate transporter 2/3/5